MPSAGDQPDAHGIPPSHKPETVVLDLVNPVGAGRRFWGGGGQARLNEARPVSGQALTHTLDRHAGNLGRQSQESNRKLSVLREPVVFRFNVFLVFFNGLLTSFFQFSQGHKV